MILARLIGRQIPENDADEDILTKTHDELGLTILDTRDKVLAAYCDQAIKEPVGTIGIVWGAGHARALALHLVKRRGYNIKSTEWMTIIAPED